MKTKIKELREREQMTQSDLANKLNVGQSTVAMWENGTNIPRVLTLVKLSNIFCCDIDDILDDST